MADVRVALALVLLDEAFDLVLQLVHLGGVGGFGLSQLFLDGSNIVLEVGVGLFLLPVGLLEGSVGSGQFAAGDHLRGEFLFTVSEEAGKGVQTFGELLGGGVGVFLLGLDLGHQFLDGGSEFFLDNSELLDVSNGLRVLSLESRTLVGETVNGDVEFVDLVVVDSMVVDVVGVVVDWVDWGTVRHG